MIRMRAMNFFCPYSSRPMMMPIATNINIPIMMMLAMSRKSVQPYSIDSLMPPSSVAPKPIITFHTRRSKSAPTSRTKPPPMVRNHEPSHAIRGIQIQFWKLNESKLQFNASPSASLYDVPIKLFVTPATPLFPAVGLPSASSKTYFQSLGMYEESSKQP